MATNIQPSRLLELRAVENLTGLKSSAIYTRIKRGEFPQPLIISARCSRWREDEVLAWIAALPRGVGPAFGAAA